MIALTVKSIAAALVLLLAGAVPVAMAAQPTYRFGIHMPEQGYLGANFKHQFAFSGRVLEKRYGIRTELVVYKDMDRFLRDVENRKLDIFFSISEEAYIKALALGAFRPVVTYSIFGTDQHRYCLYVPRDSPAKTVEDLRGTVGMNYLDAYAEIMAQDLLGESPVSFFRELRGMKGGTSAADALSLGQIDAAIIHTMAIGQLQVMNPGPLKGIRKITCGAGQRPVPFSASDSVRPEHVKLMVDITANVLNDEDFKPVHALLKALKMTFLPANDKDYAGMIRRYRQGEAEGRLKEFLAWRVYQQQD